MFRIDRIAIKEKTDLHDTMRANRKSLQKIITNFKNGEMVAFHKRKTCVLKLQDKMPLYMLSMVQSTLSVQVT